MRYRSVFVYSKIIEADRVKKQCDGAVTGFLLIRFPGIGVRPTVEEAVNTIY